MVKKCYSSHIGGLDNVLCHDEMKGLLIDGTGALLYLVKESIDFLILNFFCTFTCFFVSICVCVFVCNTHEIALYIG